MGISAAGFSLFSQAEQLAAQPNNTGLDAAILKYGECLEKEPHFRLGYARLAFAYVEDLFPPVEPGSLRPLFAPAAPEKPEPIAAILADYKRLVEPNATH